MILKIPQYPFFVKSALIILSLFLIVYVVIIGKEILSPLLFAFIISILLLPIAKFFEKKLKIPRHFSALMCVLLFIASLFLLFFALGSQIEKLIQDWPLFKAQVMLSFDTLQVWIANKFHIDSNKQLDYLQTNTRQLLTSTPLIFGVTITSMSSMLIALIFTLLFTFFSLVYRGLALKFLISIVHNHQTHVVYDIIIEVQLIIRKYVVGLFTEMVIVATTVCTAFYFLGIKYAILLGIITGLFNLIPYVGITTALLLSMLITFATTGLFFKVFLVALVIVLTHLIDANVLLPLVVGSKLKINAFAAVIGVLLGEMIWGVAGMFLAILVIAIFKIIFDRIDGLKPLGLLLGEEERN